jgi:hypothetical protein
MRFEATIQRLSEAGDALEDTDDPDSAFAAFTALLHAAIREARTGQQLACLFGLRVLEQPTFGEAYHDADTLRALWRRVLRFRNARNLARGIAIATYCCDQTPFGWAAKRPAAQLRDEPLTALVEQSTQLWRLTQATSPRVRAAAWLAVARLPELDGPRHEAMEAGVASEAAPVALGARILAIGAIASRHSLPPSPRLTGYLAHPDKLVRIAAAVALAISSRTIDDRLVPAFTEALTEPEAIPVEWCALRPRDRGTSEPRPLPDDWCVRAGSTPETTAYLVLVPLSWVDFQSRPPAALLRGLVDCADRYPDLAGNTVLRIAFPAPPAAGIVASELSAEQRIALEALAGGTSSRARSAPGLTRALAALGLNDLDSVPRLLEGTGPLFRPLPIRVGDTERRWHLGRVWRSMLLSEATVEAAVEAALSLPDDEILPALLLQKNALEFTIQGRRASELGARRAQALVSLVERLVARGADVVGYVAASADSLSNADAALAALVAAAAPGIAVPAQLDGLLADALFDDSLREAVTARLHSSLPAARVEAIVSAYERKKASFKR